MYTRITQAKQERDKTMGRIVDRKHAEEVVRNVRIVEEKSGNEDMKRWAKEAKEEAQAFIREDDKKGKKK